MRKDFAQSTVENLHQDVLLTQIAIQYRPEGIIADAIAPIVTVNKQSNTYPIFSRADALRTEDSLRSPGGMANIINRTISSDTYYANNYALKMPVTIEDKANADPIWLQELINGRAQYILDKLMLGWDVRVANQVTSGSNVGSYSGVSSAWSDASNSDPIGDLNTALDNVRDTTGKRPNCLVMGEAAWRNFRRHTDVRNLIFGTNNGGGYPNRQAVADLFEVDKFLIGEAYTNTANEAQSESISQVWNDNVLVSYTAPSPSTEIPSFMYSFRWAGGGLANMSAERHPFDPKTKSEEIEIGYYQDEKVTGSEYAFLLAAVNSST